MRYHQSDQYQHISSPVSTNVPKYRSQNLDTAKLRTVERYRKRDLFRSHAQRIGSTREEVERDANRYAYRPRSTPLGTRTNLMTDAPKVATSRVNQDPKSIGSITLSDPTGSKKSIDEIWLQSRRREANQARLKRHTQRLLNQWARQLARFEEEVTWRQETSFATTSKANKKLGEIPKNANQPKRFWVQDAWTEEIVPGEDTDDDDDDSVENNTTVEIPRVSAKDRNTGSRSAGERRHFSEKRWQLPPNTKPGSVGVAPGMAVIARPEEKPKPRKKLKTKTRRGNSSRSNRRRQTQVKPPPKQHVIGSPIVPDQKASELKAALAFGSSGHRGPSRDAISFSVYQPDSIYGTRVSQVYYNPETSGSRLNDANASEKRRVEAAAVEVAEGRVQCDRTKTRLAKYGIHIKRGNLERALLAPQLELTDQQRRGLPNILFGLPSRPKVEKKKTKKGSRRRNKSSKSKTKPKLKSKPSSPAGAGKKTTYSSGSTRAQPKLNTVQIGNPKG